MVRGCTYAWNIEYGDRAVRRTQEAVGDTVCIIVIPSNQASRVDVKGEGRTTRARHIERGDATLAGAHEAVHPVGITVISCNCACRVDALWKGGLAARRIERGD